MTMHDEYFEYCAEYTKKYGEKTVVLIECGSFMEIYAIINDNYKLGPDIQVICDILNIQLSRKNKAITQVDHSNPFMAGFPSYCLDKHSQILVSKGYTVVVIRQVTQPPNPRREVTEILSPSMQLNPSTSDGNYLMTAYFDFYTDKINKRYLIIGISGLDVSTGKTWIHEVASTNKDPSFAVDEFIRVYQLFQPIEIILLGHTLTFDEKRLIENTLSVSSAHLCWDILKNTEYLNINYQNKILEKAYNSIDNMLKPIEYLDMEKYSNATIAFCYTIQFAYEHNEKIISHLQKPTHVATNLCKCNLEYNSVIQLQIVSSNIQNEKPLLSILNKCSTAFGARNFKQILLQPISDISKLNERYDKIDEMILSGRYQIINKKLKEVIDLERIARRMYLGTFSPTDWIGYDTSLNAIIELGVATNLKKNYENILNLTECSKYNMQNAMKTNIFQKGIYEDIDKLQGFIDKYTDILNKFAECFEEGAKVEFTEREGYSIQMTKKRWETAKNKMKTIKCRDISININELSAKPLSSTSTTVKIRHELLIEASDNITKYKELISFAVLDKYKIFLKNYSNDNIDEINDLVTTIGDLDIVATNARNAVENNYKRPKLLESDESFVNAKGIRHPILEKLQRDYEYVTNDIEIGRKNKGLLLFGVNASGKSSLMKAVGLNVIMAQAGMFVATNEMTLAPYNKIFTRIAGMDNIYKGWSTFTVEMMELRNILQRADKNSLILGDELCSGTEAISALSIVSAGIEKLTNLNSSFIFATHLHDLPKLKIIKELESNNQLELAHMHIEVDESGSIIFDRKLRPGNGNSLYGIEVCKGLDMPLDFIKSAHEVRCEIQGISSLLQDDKMSRYNSKVFMGKCELCNKLTNNTETHHIQEQNSANEDGFIEIKGYHKNKEFNLIVLCENCHIDLHKKKVTIGTKKQTTKGVKLKN